MSQAVSYLPDIELKSHWTQDLHKVSIGMWVLYAIGLIAMVGLQHEGYVDDHSAGLLACSTGIGLIFITTLLMGIKRGYDTMEREDIIKPVQEGELVSKRFENDDVPGRLCAYHTIAAYTYVSYLQSTPKGLAYGPWETIEAHKYNFIPDNSNYALPPGYVQFSG